MPPFSGVSGRAFCAPRRRTGRAGGRLVRTGGPPESPAAGGARYKPPLRDTGIALEKDMAIELRDDAASGVNEDGSSWWRKSGEDRGAGGYRCRWTVMGGAARDGSWEYKETWWEKADWSGFKELGAEKSGFNGEGDAWWETWREAYTPGAGAASAPGSGSGSGSLSGLAAAAAAPPGAALEKSADKWARDGEGREWHEQWWERYSAGGGVEKGARKSGRASLQAWWETWGERHDAAGGVLKWTDKWAESGTAGARWGDKWEERFAAPAGGGGGAKQGETWRVSASGERWSRTWGETHTADGSVRKYGRSTSGEAWDTVAAAQERYTWQQPLSWVEVIATAQQLLAIEQPPRDAAAVAAGGAARGDAGAAAGGEGGAGGAGAASGGADVAGRPSPGGEWAGPAVVVPKPPPPPSSEQESPQRGPPRGPGPGPGPPRGF